MPVGSIDKTTIAILAGGFGTRLQSVVSDRSKVIADIGGRPFIAFLLDQLADAGVKEVVLCTGYKANTIEEQFGKVYRDISLVYSKEPKPLGTGGALRFAFPFLNSDPVMVMNGDSFIQEDLRAYHDWFLEKKRDASLLLVEVEDVKRFGNVVLTKKKMIKSFVEKGDSEGKGLINAGIYIMKKDIIERIPKDKNHSLERDIFPGLIGMRLYGHISKGRFIDIGTPESYQKSQTFFKRLKSNCFRCDNELDKG